MFLQIDDQNSTCVMDEEIESDQLVTEERNKQLCLEVENLNLMLLTINDDLVRKNIYWVTKQKQSSGKSCIKERRKMIYLNN